MVQKRRSSTRVETASKQRMAGSISHSTRRSKTAATADATIKTAPKPVEKPLPVKIKDGAPLPTLPEPQPPLLSVQEYQSFSER